MPKRSLWDNLKDIGAVVVTIVFALLVAWWLLEVARRLGTRPIVENGAVTLDEFQRAKDILVLVLPLLTAAAGYWFGNKGAEGAKDDAERSKEETRKAEARLQSLLAVTPPEVNAQAMQAAPGLWDEFRAG
jgi:hypothetical protein